MQWGDVPRDSLRLRVIALEWKSILPSGGDKMGTGRSLSSADGVVEGEYVEQRSEKSSDRTIGRNWFSPQQESASAGAEVNDLLPQQEPGVQQVWDLRETPGQAARLSHCVKPPPPVIMQNP